MKYSRIIDISGALLASTLVVVFEKWYLVFNLNPVFALVLAIASAALAEIILETGLSYLPKRIYLLRKAVYPIAKYEGMWLQVHLSKKTSGTRYMMSENPEYALCNLQYSPHKDEYVFKGDHYSPDSFDIVRFASVNVYFNEDQSEFYYLVQGKHASELYNCWGKVGFKNQWDGYGTFYDLGSILAETDFHMKKLEKETVKKLNACNSIADQKRLLVEYIHSHPYSDTPHTQAT